MESKTPEPKKNKYGTVSLPMPLIDEVKRNIEGTGINSVSAYVTFILRQILSNPTSTQIDIMNQKTEEDIKARLRSLGYLD